MMRLNLLPWRERQRQATLRRFRSRLVAGAILALCAVMLVDQLARCYEGCQSFAGFLGMNVVRHGGRPAPEAP